MKIKIKGFSLIELIIAISILAILSTIGILNYGKISKTNRDARRITDLNSVKQALELYKRDNRVYPQCLFSGCNPPPLQSYMPTLPQDPSSSFNYKYVAQPNNCTTSCTSYYLCAKNESGRNYGTLNVCQGIICGSSVDSCGIEVASP